MNGDTDTAQGSADPLQARLQHQMDGISIEMCQPLDRVVAQERRVTFSGDSDEARQMRFASALNRVVLGRLSPIDRPTSGSGLSCFTVSMGIKADAWCKTCSIEYEPDCVFVPRAEANRMPYSVFRAVSMIEIAWTNRPFLDNPAVIDPGPFFGELQSYVMADIASRRLVLFRRAAGWRPEPFASRQLPSRIDGLDFEIDWQRAYDAAGVAATEASPWRRFARGVMNVLGRAPE